MNLLLIKSNSNHQISNKRSKYRQIPSPSTGEGEGGRRLIEPLARRGVNWGIIPLPFIPSRQGRGGFYGYYILSGVQLAAFGHIEEDAIPGLIDAEGFSLLIDMLDHQFGRFYWIGLESPFPF